MAPQSWMADQKLDDEQELKVPALTKESFYDLNGSVL